MKSNKHRKGIAKESKEEEKKREVYGCECGGSYTQDRHLETLKHKQYEDPAPAPVKKEIDSINARRKHMTFCTCCHVEYAIGYYEEHSKRKYHVKAKGLWDQAKLIEGGITLEDSIAGLTQNFKLIKEEFMWRINPFNATVDSTELNKPLPSINEDFDQESNEEDVKKSRKVALNILKEGLDNYFEVKGMKKKERKRNARAIKRIRRYGTRYNNKLSDLPTLKTLRSLSFGAVVIGMFDNGIVRDEQNKRQVNALAFRIRDHSILNSSKTLRIYCQHLDQKIIDCMKDFPYGIIVHGAGISKTEEKTYYLRVNDIRDTHK
jgi:hypothetical protein